MPHDRCSRGHANRIPVTRHATRWVWIVAATVLAAAALSGCGTTRDGGSVDQANSSAADQAGSSATVVPRSGAPDSEIVRDSVQRAANAESVKWSWRDAESPDFGDIEVSPKEGIWYEDATVGGVRSEIILTRQGEYRRGDERLVKLAHDKGHTDVTIDTWVSLSGDRGEISGVLKAGLDHPIEMNIVPPESISHAEQVGTEVIDGRTTYEYAVTLDRDRYLQSIAALVPSVATDPQFDQLTPADVHVWIDEDGILRKATVLRQIGSGYLFDSLSYNEPLSVRIPSEAEVVRLGSP